MNSRMRILEEQRRVALAQARKIVDDAEASGRQTLDAAEEARYDAFVADYQRYDAALAKEKTHVERDAATRDARAVFAGAGRAASAGDDTFLAEFGAALEVGRRDAVSWNLPPSAYVGDMLPVLGAREAQYLYDAHALRAAVSGSRELRTDYPMTTTDAATTYSSYAVPTLVANRVEEKAYQASAVLQGGADIIVTDGINELGIPKVTTDPVITAPGAENTAPTDSAYAVLGRTVLNGYRAGAYVVLTEEDIASSAGDILGFVTRNLAGAVGAKVAYYLAVGTGSSQPHGLFVAATTGKTAASATTFTGDEVIESYQSVSAEYRPGLRCCVSQAAESLLMRLKDLDDRYIYQAGLAFGAPNTLLGVPLAVDPQGPALTTGKKPIVFYNPSNFHVRWAMGGNTRIDVSTEAQFTQWNRIVRIARWFDCDLGDAGAAKSLTLA